MNGFVMLASNAPEYVNNAFADFISTYGVTILWTILTTVAGLLANAVRKYYKKYVDTKTKEQVVKTVVMAMEQLYKNLNGEEKLNTALRYASEMLQEKGITITDLELRMLIEAAVGEFNNVFNKEDEKEIETAIEEPKDDEEKLIKDIESGCIYPAPKCYVEYK